MLILVFGFSPASGQRANAANSLPAPDQTPSATSQTAQEQDQNSPEDEPEKPVKKKQFVPAASLGEALYLSSREDRHTVAYLDQARTMLAQPNTDAKAADDKGRTPLHWAVIGAMYADKKQIAAYCDVAELLIAGGTEVNAEDAYGNTPLDYQEMSAAQEMMELLLEADARPGGGQSEVAQLGALLLGVAAAAKVGDMEKVRAALAADLPLSTPIHVKLITPVSSNGNRAGDAIEAVVAAPVVVDNRLVIAPGTRLVGTLLHATKSYNRFERSQLVLDFANLTYADGTKARLVLRVTDIDNARETIEMNRIIGVSFPNSAMNQKKVTWGRRLVGTAFPMVGYAMEAATLVYNRKFDREIRYDAGTDMTLEVRIPAKVNPPANLKRWPAYTPSAELVRLVNAQPARVDTQKGDPVDLTNVMLIGS
ncbi:MAG: ankyrin repeat domain-containing protein, partial [Rubrivivax sp.]|nr:ankyrin repeat domain-containing protein [Pyrinomonadaceae bacterium]